MKVLIVSPGLLPVPSPYGGTEMHVYYLANSLAAQGVEVHLVADGDPAAFAPGVTLHPVRFHGDWSARLGFTGYALQHLLGGWAAYRAARPLLKEFAIVHAHGRWAPYFLSRHNDVRLVFTLHDSPPTPWLTSNLWRRVIYSGWHHLGASKIPMCSFHNIVVARDALEELRERGVPIEKCSHIPNGVDTGLFYPRPARIPDTIVFVGSLISRKGVKYLLQAMTLLPERYRLEIAGDGPSRAKLEDAVNRLGLTGRVAFLGALTQDELAELLGRCHTFVLPSLSEGLPLSLLEAMASGCAVVSTDVSGIKDLVTDGVTGLLVPPADPQALVQALLRVLSDEELSRRLSSNALALVQERYSWESVAKRVAAVYASALADGKPSP